MFTSFVKKTLTIVEPKKKLNAIILGTGQAETSLYKKLHRKGNYHILFFIDQTPWQLKFSIRNSMCFHVSELSTLCEKNEINIIFYLDDMWLKEVANQHVTLTKYEDIH